MKRRLWFAACVTLYSASALPEIIDWERARDGVPYEQAIAYSGCAPSKSITDQIAYKIALLRAQANIARSKNIVISGKEQLVAKGNNQGDKEYRLTVTESTNAFLDKVEVVHRELVDLHDSRQLCLLVAEARK